MVGGRKTKIARFHHFLKVLTGEFSSHKMFNSELKHNEKSLSRVLFLKKKRFEKGPSFTREFLKYREIGMEVGLEPWGGEKMRFSLSGNKLYLPA